MEQLLAKAKHFVMVAFICTDKAHDYSHAIRVVENAKYIVTKEFSSKPINMEVILLSSILHDVADKKLFKSENLLDRWFSDTPSNFEHEIRKTISEISYSSGAKPSSIESMIVQDADRLDAIGAIGIARVFTYGGAIGRPIYSDDGFSSISHFGDKLLNIKEHMNTQTGKQLAEKRESYMRAFISELWKEVSIES